MVRPKGLFQIKIFFQEVTLIKLLQVASWDRFVRIATYKLKINDKELKTIVRCKLSEIFHREWITQLSGSC